MSNSDEQPEAVAGSGDLVADALKVLETAVASRTVGDRAPTASEVRIAMKQLTYDGFDPKALGFQRFRDFLALAEAEGLVTLHTDRPGDLLVSVRGGAARPKGHVRVRRDLWRAVLDWAPDVDHYLDLEQDRVLTLPTKPVPLEPVKFSQVRGRVDEGDPTLVLVPAVPIRTQIGWMERFATALDDEQLRSLLVGALHGDKPAKLFSTVLRNEPAAQDRWQQSLATNVLAHLQKWKDDDPGLADVRIVTEGSPPASAKAHETAATAAAAAPARALVDAAGSIILTMQSHRSPSSRSRRRSGSEAEEQLRNLLHQAIDRMPEEELRVLRIPVGYLLED
ncbi:UPF0158 family protein [uncultured Nocardioides sp.]|uniref:UPF0158 family protein n=1 Tax=uncultured Nocardioides sp. TaxID=198441 RepID=UPI0026031937|nr:UPF0158 family protein [uncultured Nocardioides sp.]